jgi:hypothetical protein
LVGSGCQRACGQGNLPEIIIGREAETVPSIFRAAMRGETRPRSTAAGNRWRTQHVGDKRFLRWNPFRPTIECVIIEGLWNGGVTFVKPAPS